MEKILLQSHKKKTNPANTRILEFSFQNCETVVSQF